MAFVMRQRPGEILSDASVLGDAPRELAPMTAVMRPIPCGIMVDDPCPARHSPWYRVG
jgi:hypothetical protein